MAAIIYEWSWSNILGCNVKTGCKSLGLTINIHKPFTSDSNTCSGLITDCMNYEGSSQLRDTIVRAVLCDAVKKGWSFPSHSFIFSERAGFPVVISQSFRPLVQRTKPLDKTVSCHNQVSLYLIAIIANKSIAYSLFISLVAFTIQIWDFIRPQ